jgi:CBS domain-containing protein
MRDGDRGADEMNWVVSDVMSEDVAPLGSLGEVIAADVVTTTANMPLANAASLMFQHRVKVLPVVDSERRLVGILSRPRLLRVFLRSDDSIHREIARDFLKNMPLLDYKNVDAVVRDGVVHLYGEVDEERPTGLLVRLLAEVPGVVGVESHLEPASRHGTGGLASAGGCNA